MAKSLDEVINQLIRSKGSTEELYEVYKHNLDAVDKLIEQLQVLNSKRGAPTKTDKLLFDAISQTAQNLIDNSKRLRDIVGTLDKGKS